MVQLAIQKCLDKESLCNEFYLQLIKQTTDQPGRESLATESLAVLSHSRLWGQLLLCFKLHPFFILPRS